MFSIKLNVFVEAEWHPAAKWSLCSLLAGFTHLTSAVDSGSTYTLRRGAKPLREPPLEAPVCQQSPLGLGLAWGFAVTSASPQGF